VREVDDGEVIRYESTGAAEPAAVDSDG
jgi:hypothetical protein